MGNCTSKISKENKRDMKEEVYRLSDTVKLNDPLCQDAQATKNGSANNALNSVEIAKGINVMKNSVDSKCHGNTEEMEQVNMPVKQESVEPAIPKSEIILIQSKNTESEAMATDTNVKEETKSECESMDPKVKVSDNSGVTPVNDEQDYTEIKGKPYNFSKGREKPDLPESEFLDTKSWKTEPAHHNEDIKTDGSDQSPDPKDEKDPADNKKDEIGHSNLLDCDQNGMLKSNGSETEKDNSGQTNVADRVPPKSASSDGDKSHQRHSGGDEFAFPTNNEFKKDEKGKTDPNEVVKSKTKKKKKKDRIGEIGEYVVQPGTTVSHHVYNEPIETLFIGCDNVVVKHEKIEEKRETAQTTRMIHSVETMNILSEVAKSVGHIRGPKESGTCWRVGNDKIITAAHVVVDNIWDALTAILFEPLLGQFRVDFDYISKQSSSQFKVIPKVLLIDKSLDIAVLQLKPDEKKPFPPPLKMFHVLNPEKDGNKQIYLISHNQSKKKKVNSGIGIWKPTEKKLEDLEKFCQQYGEENGYIGLDKKDRLVIRCDFVSGASGSPGIVILNNVAYVVLVYIRGFPSFYHNELFSEEQKRTFPSDKLFQHGVNIGNLYANMSSGTYIVLRNEIFSEEALKLKQTINQHQLAISGDKTSSNTETTETSTGIAKGKMDNISKKSETKIPISKATACTDQSEDNIPESANYRRLMSHSSVPGQTFITSPQEDTDRYNITSNQSAQDIKTDGSDKCTVQDQGSHSHSSTGNAAAENHNLHAKEGEMITLQRSPGRTRLLSAGQISIENSVKHHQIRIRCDQGIPIKTIKDGMKLRLHSEGQLQTLTKPTGSWVSKLVICCDGRMVNIDSSCKSTSISTDNINLLKIKKDSSNYLQALLGNTDKEFEILMTLSTLLKINRIKPEDWLVPVIKHQHQMACYMLLAYMNEPNTNKEDAITNALKMAIEKNDKNITNTLCWFIIREYFKCVSFQIDGLLDVWPAMVCKKLNCHEFDQCSKDVVVVVEMVKSAKYLPKQFWNIPIEYLSQNDVIQIETKHSSKNTNVDVSIHDCFPEKFEIDGNLASNLFEKHSKLTFICKSIYKSKDCVKVYHPCVQLFCRRKGLIPIKENHFPKFINNVKTNILEGEPVFASRIRAGEQIKSTYYTGTLGGFVKIMGDITFITCAHVVVNKDVISGRKLSIPNNESTHIECVQISPNSIDTFRCGKLRYIEFKTDRPGETSIDAALIALSEGIGIDNDDFIANRRSNKHSLKLLGLKSPFLNENCLDYEKMFYGKHFSQFHNVTIGAISSISVNGSKIVVPEDKDDGIHVDLESIVDTFKRVMQSENQQNVQSSMFSSAAPVFSNNAHTQETRLLKLDKERTYRRLSRSMYNQIAVTHIPFKPGDSGTCVYVCDNSLGAYGCMGMAIANHPGPDGGVILTPMKEILKTFHVDIQ